MRGGAPQFELSGGLCPSRDESGVEPGARRIVSQPSPRGCASRLELPRTLSARTKAPQQPSCYMAQMGPYRRPASHSPWRPTQTSPSSKYSFFQTGTVSLRVSIAKRQASKETVPVWRSEEHTSELQSRENL